ncbi:MAG TPA: 23S rRNA (pseudouridine(1915)-N(3))-methyltransferase RlmH [Candidatus Rubrimentiphilum sp.]|nr:23S rRNA (pseudouridine(1915)-N(3))-methyltransferase RlmH [Candidatus Rubrimentiphilum sp.]
MRVRIVTVGKLRDKALASLCAELQKRLRPYHRLEIVEAAASRVSDAAIAAREEGERILDRIAEPPIWLVDRDGTELGSMDLAQRVAALEQAGTAQLTLIVGGTFGVSPAVRERAGFVWSLSKLTFLHEWARAIVLEQLYRAAKINRGEPYHH